MDKISYAIGLSMGQNLMGSGVTSLEYADLAAGIKDVLEKNQPQISYQEAQQVLGKFFSELEQKIAGEAKAAGEEILFLPFLASVLTCTKPFASCHLSRQRGFAFTH